MTQTPAGWYPDPYGSPQLRWWDGTQWTDATHPLESPAGQSAPVTTGQWAQPGAGTQPSTGQPGTGQHPQPGTGAQPQPGTGPQFQPGTGPQFQPGTGPQFQPGTGPQFQPGTGAYPQNPQPGTGQNPQMGTGSYPQPGTGPHPQPGPPQGQGPYPQQGPAQFAPPAQQGTTPLGAPGSPYGGPTGPQPWGGQGGTAQFPVPEFGPQGPPPKKSVMPWVIGGGAVVILLVVALVIGISVVNRDTTPIAAETPAPSTSVEPSDPQITPPLETTPTPDPSTTDLPAELPQPKGNIISDPRTGLSYSYPGSEWTVPKWSDLNGNGRADPNFPQWTSGYEAVSQENFDGQDNNWVGQVLTCRLPEVFDYSGPRDLRNVAGNVLMNYGKFFYSLPHKKKIIKNAALDVSGKKAWILRFEMDFTDQAKKAGYKFRKEEGMILLVDQGSGQRPSMLYASVPDNLDTSVIDRVLDSLKAS
ncbi:DUF2510 domain-containing protein [Sphaerisporangium viridialbum]|uniref:DUF2510 domain-containing protein n=1 Tax=Sphaerisporangium viridialbum TaxID=46189 RepID=UPI003C72B29B